MSIQSEENTKKKRYEMSDGDEREYLKKIKG